MTSIFISYRRDDSADVTGRINDRLAEHFGQDLVFTDVDSIPLGVNFARYIDEQVGKCQILLAVVGRDWLSVADEQGKLRLRDPKDFVRLEIESALKRDIPVIPLLVQDARMPAAKDLPRALKELPVRNGMPIRPNPDFHSDMARLVKGIERHLGKRVKVGDVFSDSLKDGSDGPAMVFIPTGKFLMGSPSDEPGRGLFEGPSHEVEFREPLAIGKYAVTFEEYERFARTDGRPLPDDESWGTERRPVINVSWNDAVDYTHWLSDQTGASYRLPSEAEWGYAARAGTSGPFSFDGPISWEKVNYVATNTYAGSEKGKFRKETVKVGSLPANPWGLYEVHGNVLEWCSDDWHGTYDGAPSNGSAWTDGKDGRLRVLRGGSWNHGLRGARSASRHRETLDARNDNIGFRLARTL